MRKNNFVANKRWQEPFSTSIFLGLPSERTVEVESATEWPWSSLQHPTLADPSPVPLPDEWLRWIDEPLFDHELATLRTCLNRQSPTRAAQKNSG